jgi:hydrophobe/amphiphile efflux-1 (HAE1) family protein
MQWLASISVRRPVLATVSMLVFVVVGLVGYRTLGVDKFPKVDFPRITIVTPYPGASPKAVESDVTRKIEEAINTVGGLESLTSSSTEGASLVVAQFALEVDVDKAASDVSERVATTLRDLPPGSRPEIKKADPDVAPVIVLSVNGPVDASGRERTRIADKVVKQRIERLRGVGQVVILGGQKRQINVHLDAIRLAAAGVSALEVQRAMSTSNVDSPAGRLETGPTNNTLRTAGRALDLDAIGAIVVRQRGDNPIRVRDVATVEDGEEDAATAASRDGVPAIALSVRKQSGQNTIEVVDRVRAAVEELRREMPAGYTVDIVRDNSLPIRTAASQVLEHLVVGAGLAALVVLLFLGSLRSTLIAAVSIPVSIVSTFGLMMVAGFTLNLMTLLALALAVGIVIDDAIVVLENIHRFIDENRMQPFPAAIHATKEIGLAVLATTLSLMAVFLPVAFMSGVVGRFLFSFGVTMAFAIGVSMIVAFTLTPMMAARMLPPPPPAGEERRRSGLERSSDLLHGLLSRVYSGILSFCLRRRWIVGVVMIGSCATTFPLARQVGGDFLPPNDEAQFEVLLQTPEGTALEATALLAERIARDIRSYPQVASTLVTIADGDQRQSNVGRIYVGMTDPSSRVLGQAQMMETVRREVLPDVPKQNRVVVQPVNDFSVGGQNASVSYMISGPDLDKLEVFGKRVVARLRKVPGVADADSSLLDPVAETVVRPDLARAALVGVDPADVTATLATLVGGVRASTFEDDGEQYDVFMRAAERFRNDAAAFSLITVPSRTLGQVPLSDVVTVGEGLATSTVTRYGRERAVVLRMNVSPGFSDSAVVAALEKALGDLDMPPGYRFESLGRSKEMAKMKGAFTVAIALAFAFMYLVLAAQFESWLHPFTIMMSLPLVVPFAIMSLVITGGSLNIFSMLGLIVLFAMVKKNAILQVDRANELRRLGLPRTRALIQASRDRLRPILMTTFAFVAGMLPLVTSQGIGAGFSKAIASIVVGGQLLSLLLTLVAIPVIYTWMDDLARGGSRLAGKLRRRPPVRRGATELGIRRREPAHGPLHHGDQRP